MKNIKINRITYENFKGIKSFDLDLEKKDANVSARNAIGKTTLFDGFYWLLFGKDSAENSKFDVKPFDENGNEILGKEPIVEAELVIDHKTVTLRRELKEVWSTIKGRLEKERKSDKTKYYIDGVPVKTQKEYQEFITSIVDENIFKLLTNPFAFNGLHWADRRDILMSLVDDVSVDDVIKSNDELEGLKEILEGRSPEDQKAIVKSKMKEIKKDIDGLTVRFDEAERAIPDTASLDQTVLNAQLKSKTAEYEKLQTEAVEIKNGGAIAKFQQQIDGIKHKINEGKLQFSQSNQLAVSSFADDLEWTKSKLRAAKDNAEDYKYNIQRLEKHISNIKNEKTKLLDQYHKENAVTFDEHRTTCAMCGQNLPEDQISSMKNSFNKDKSEKVAKILEDGKTKATEIQIAEKQLSDMKEELVSIEKEREKYQVLANNLETEIEKVRAGNQKYEESNEYQEYVQQGLDLQEKITTEQESKRTLLEDIAENQIELTKAIDEIKQSLSLIDLAKRQTDRLTELKNLHKKMVDTYNSLQGQEFMLDEFTRSRVQLLEEQINQQFKYAKFKLFQLQKNGGIDEVCEATFNGIAYTNNLNNAARINVGLDIINTLSNHYQVSAPIFVDNAESVNELIETQAQMISLIVSEDIEFKVEV
ncbi:AAA family ATPase [Desemzia incerta]|uniref:AAA family ATPase n=1 Tax=Desemzia incerta TaxID=82801 RepID=UPI003CFFB9D4